MDVDLNELMKVDFFSVSMHFEYYFHLYKHDKITNKLSIACIENVMKTTKMHHIIKSFAFSFTLICKIVDSDAEKNDLIQLTAMQDWLNVMQYSEIIIDISPNT